MRKEDVTCTSVTCSCFFDEKARLSSCSASQWYGEQDQRNSSSNAWFSRTYAGSSIAFLNGRMRS